MIQYGQLNCQEQLEIRKNAMNYLNKHKTKIYKNISEQTEKISPTGNDLFSPELWKSSHWKWFLDNSFLL